MGRLPGKRVPNERVDLKADERPASAAASTADPGDEHVCALAISGGADVLITSDRGYVVEALRAHSIDVRTPDEILTAAFQDQPEAVLPVLNEQTAAWAGGRPLNELLDAIDRAGAKTFIAAVRQALAE